MRQAWINDQRADFATFGAAAQSLAAQRSENRAADFDKFEAAAYRIRLRENPRKTEWQAVIEKMDAIRRDLLANESSKVEVLPTLVEIGALSQLRLKKDWNKVRFGELGYRGLLVLLAVLAGVLFWMGYQTLAGPATAAKPTEQHLSGRVELVAPAESASSTAAALPAPSPKHCLPARN